MNRETSKTLPLSDTNYTLPSIDEAGVIAVKISEMVNPRLTANEQSFFIAGFCECIKWINISNNTQK